ncbi:hypothetical protein D9756_008764 [Leucocoprinus leucothites]|uniref:Citrate transporter-like domain-containing protein n=1 Tax=Leucocoprinus leucothites TaxID=201217 RepID=A0A8H5CZU2_9AGAR|nr:hypothetical protein D9756_008764 [Leucoagaricus leucothites]
MSSQDAGPSISYTPPYTRRRPPNRLSPSAYNIPQRPMVLQHHRRTSGSALTIQTQFNKQPNITSHSATQEYPNNPHFSHMMNSMLGSPYLTTTDIPQTPPHFNLDNNEGEEYDTHRARPPSPAPTADYSFIDVEELEGDNVPTVQMPGSYPYGHRRSISSSFAGFGIQSPAAWSSPRGHTYYTSPGLGGVPFISLNHPTESISMPNIPQQSNPFKTLLPRIWDALSSPGKAFSGSHNINSPPTSSPASIDSSPAGSPRIFSHSISLPTQLFSSQSPSGHHSPLLWNSNSRSQNKGKGRAQPSPYSPFASEPAEDVHFSELSPLDGEEGELIDEACFVDVRAVTGVDILRLLPPELAVYILQLVCPPPVRCHMQHAPGAEKQDPLVNEAEEKSKVALRAILACLTVSRTWRRLASDNPVWHALFLGRWDVDLRKADMSHMWKFEAGSSANIVDSPSRQLKRHRWKLKPRAQAFKFGASLKHSTTQCRRPQSSLLSPHLTPHLAHKALRHPKQNFPLQFDWQKMYMDRLGLEKRWLGTSYVHVPMSLPEEPPCIRETSRSMTSREAPRSRSLSPARLLRGGNTLSAIAGCSVDHLAESTSVGRAAGKTAELRAIPASRTEPVNMNLVFKAEKWEPERRELHGHTDSVYCVDFDSQRIITGSRDRTVIAWSLKTGRRLGTFVGAHTGKLIREFKHTHTSLIFDVKFNLGRIVSASHDQRICVLDFTTVERRYFPPKRGVIFPKLVHSPIYTTLTEPHAPTRLNVINTVTLAFHLLTVIQTILSPMVDVGLFSILTLTLFLLPVPFTLHPVKIPVPLPFLGWRTLPIDLYSAPIFAIVVLWALQCLGIEQVYDGIVGTDNIRPYKIIITFLSLAYISITLDVTGVLEAAVFWAGSRARSDGWKLYIYFYIIVTILGLIFSSDPVIHSTGAFLADFTIARGLQPLPWLISAFAAINTPAMVLFTGNPTNFIICDIFDINKAVFSAYTILPFAACSIVCLLVSVRQFRGTKYFPSQPSISGWTTARDSLQDATATVAGIFFLGCCLVVSLGLGFLHIGVWGIILSFAGLKSFIDLFCDHNRFVTAARASSTYSLVASTPSTFPASILGTALEVDPETRPTPSEDGDNDQTPKTYFGNAYRLLTLRFPTFFNALPQLPFGLIPLVFSQSILVEALSKHGWIELFGRWLAAASGGKMIPIIWTVGIIGVLLCNFAGTNIGTTILLAKVIRQANLDGPSETGAAIALAVVSNIGAVNLSFSSSRSAFLWRAILQQEGIIMTWSKFAKWNSVPLVAMTCVGLAIVGASGDGKMILWNIESGERLRTFDGHDRGLACIEFKVPHSYIGPDE